MSMEKNLAAAFVWGMNKPSSHKSQNSFLIEAYGNSPFSVEVFLRLSPGATGMNHSGMHDMQHGM